MKCAKIKLWQLLVKKEESEASWRSVVHVGMNNFPEVHKYTLKKGRPVVENSIFNWSIVLKKVDSGFWVCELYETEVLSAPYCSDPSTQSLLFFFPISVEEKKGLLQFHMDVLKQPDPSAVS